MIEFLTDWPPETTNKAWQKAKSIKDKVMGKTKTGLGEELEAAEAAWNKINWVSLDARTAMSKIDPSSKFKGVEEFEFAKAVAEAELGNQVAVTRKILLKASKAAHNTTKNKDLSKDAVAKATEISNTLLGLEKHLRDIKLKDFDEKKTRYLELFAMEMKKFGTNIEQLEKALTTVLKSPTKETWNKEAKQKFRSVCNTLGNYPKNFGDSWKTWVKFDGCQADNHPELKKGVDAEREKQIIVELVKEVVPHLKKLKELASKL